MPSHAVRGPGYRFWAPTAWRVRRSTFETGVYAVGSRTFVLVQPFPLRKRYDPARFGQAAKELDGVADKLAAEAHGSVTERSTTTVDGRKVRAYRLRLPKYDARVGFLFVGKREYQLYCQAPHGAGDPDGACSLLFSSFSVT